MKRPLLLGVLLMVFLSSIQAQTALIAHLSKSGKASEFTPKETSDNFGLPAYSVIEIRKISDTSVVEMSAYYGGTEPMFYDTLYEKDGYHLASLPLDSVRQLYQYSRVKITGWEEHKSQKEKGKSKKGALLPLSYDGPDSRLWIGLAVLALGLFRIFMPSWRKLVTT